MRTVRYISPGSVFKVSFVAYAILIALFGALFIVLPGLLGAGVLSGVLGERGGLRAFGGGMAVTGIIYVTSVIGGALVQSIFTAIAAIFYNIVAAMVGGIRIDLGE